MNLDATRIMSQLYQGSVPPSADAVRAAGFHTLVLCAVEIQPPDAALSGLAFMRCPLTDNPTVPLSENDWNAAWKTAQSVVRRMRAGQRVLVTCAAGRNRSGLVTVLALHQMTKGRGSSCIAIVKHHRGPGACTNPQFNEAVVSRLG